MIKATFKFEWNDQEYLNRITREIQRTVHKSGYRVQKAAKELLKESGKGVTAKLGLNTPGKGSSKMTATQKNEAIFNNGKNAISGLKTVKGVKTASSLTFGGNYKGTDRIYWYGNPLHRWVQSSPPGSPPHKQHGTLQRSITVEPVENGMRVKVGPAKLLKYSRIQELGGKGLIRLPARPYMKPAFESQQQAILDDFQEAIKRAIK